MALLGLLILPWSLALFAPGPASAFELLSWWRRGLLEVDLVPGDWARFAVAEITEDGAVTDTLTVTVLADDAGSDGDTAEPGRWIRITGSPGEPEDYLLVQPERLRPDVPPLDAVRRVLRLEIDGTWVEEDLEEHRRSRIARRHLEDPFEDPTVRREALSDTTVGGHRIPRERLILSETRREERSMGQTTLVIETDLHARAELSEHIPLIGLLRSTTRSLVTTRTVREGGQRGRRAQPPLFTETSLHCLDFGRYDPPPTAEPPR